MLMIFPYSTVFRRDERLFMPVKTQFFAIRQDQTTLLLTFIDTFEARTIHEWICQFMRKTMVQIPSP